MPTESIDPGAELLVIGTPSADGYLLEVAAQDTEWHPQPLAVLNTGEIDTRSWIGYECVTGNGEFVVAVVAPWEAANHPELRDRGAVAFGVEIRTRKVTQLAEGVALKHFNPGCGDDSAAFVRHLGVDQEQSEVLVVDVATGDVIEDTTVDGQLIGAVRSGDETLLFRDTSMAVLRDGDERERIPTGGQPYMITASDGGATFLAAQGGDAQVRRIEDGRVETLGEYKLGEVKLHEGLNGDVTAVVRRGQVGEAADGLTWVNRPDQEPLPNAVATDGSAVLESFGGDSVSPTESISLSDGEEILERPSVQVDMSLPPEVLKYEVSSEELAAAVATGPVCAVPRNDPRRMAPQSDRGRVRWAIEQAVSENTNFVWPANYLNQGWAQYAPSVDFPIPDLAGPTKKIPAAVAWATFAQESNWKQASRRSLPGTSANPTIASYYGAPYTAPTSTIDYDKADCGYGLAQVTDGMRNDDNQRTSLQEHKIALDYYANASAGAQILADKWNQMAFVGMEVNGGDAKYLENWYFALWAYNSGLRTNAQGEYGLGWGNNPKNSDYPPDRLPFLRFNFDDAKYPSDWPYQERVLGWMETPLWSPSSGDRYYPRPLDDADLKLPAYDAFCTSSNQCDPSWVDPDLSDGDQSYCLRADRWCWWHEDINFADCAVAGGCALSVPAQVSNVEPAPMEEAWPPNCTGLPAGIPEIQPGMVLIDDVPNGTPNVEGCPNAFSMGTFTPTFGQNAAGAPLAEIDWHQLGTGFGGHTWFTDNVAGDDTAHIVRGRWTPTWSLWGQYRVYAHVPPAGARTTSAVYDISTGYGIYKATIDQITRQNDPDNGWATLGVFNFFGEGSYVELSNVTGESAGTTTIGFDSVMFVPEAGHQEESSLVRRGASWRYLDTGEVPSGWAREDFDDSEWESGYAPLGFGATDVETSIDRTSNGGHVTDLFRRDFMIDDLNDVWQLDISMRYDDAIAVWINGIKVVGLNLPTEPDPPEPDTPAVSERSSPAQDTYETDITINNGILRDGRNVVAVELHQSASSSPDSVFDLGITGLTAPMVSDLQFDNATGEVGQDTVRFLDVSFTAIPEAINYKVYQHDFTKGVNAVPQLVADITAGSGDAQTDERGRIVVTVPMFLARYVLSDFYVVTEAQFGNVSAPSDAVRVHIIPNVTRAADGDGPDISYSRTTKPLSPPGQIPKVPPSYFPTQAPKTLPPEGPSGRGGGLILVAALAEEYLSYLAHELTLDIESRIPDDVLTIPSVYFTGREPTQGEVEDLADELETHKVSQAATAPTLTRTDYETIARECLRSGLVAYLNEDACMSFNILIPGRNDYEATDHIANAIGRSKGRLAILSRDIAPATSGNKGFPRDWYLGISPCNLGLPEDAGKQCDEYPFYAAAQNTGTSPPVHLKMVNPDHNQHVGSFLSGMYSACNVQPASAAMEPDGGQFLVLPMPPGSGVDTTYICGFAAK